MKSFRDFLNEGIFGKKKLAPNEKKVNDLLDDEISYFLAKSYGWGEFRKNSLKKMGWNTPTKDIFDFDYKSEMTKESAIKKIKHEFGEIVDITPYKKWKNNKLKFED